VAKSDSVRAARVCGDARVFFVYKRLGVFSRCYSILTAANKHLRAELEVCNVEVPVVFFGTVGFSARVEG